MTNMENLNEIKLMWQALNERVNVLEDENRSLMKKVMHSCYRSTKEKLEKKYFGFIGIESIMIIFMTLFFLYNPFINEKYRYPALIYWAFFFLLEIILDVYLLIQIKRIDIYTSTINEVAKRAARNWKIHKIAVAAGLPLAFGAIFLFALALNANTSIIYGMAVGGVIGLAIGINQLLKFRNYYKLLQTNEQ